MFIKLSIHNIFFLFIFFGISASYHSAFSQKLDNENFERILIERENKHIAEFLVEIADSKEKRQKGLMYKKKLLPNHGMLFDFKSSMKVSFWMKNTYIPLDLIFIDKSGFILKIYENAVPLSTDPINSILPVRAVLEINAGMIKKYNIKTGDKVIYIIFK